MKTYGLIGKTLKHSFSHDFFTKKFAQLGLAGTHQYLNFELEKIEIVDSILQRKDLCGLNVTIPYKESILPFLDNVSDAVKVIGACNCVKFENGKTFGFNTDVVGFKNSLLPLLLPHHRSALVLGTGGAAKAIQYVLKELQIPFQTVSRSGNGNMEYNDISEAIINDHLIIINTTPVGMFPNIEAAPELQYQFISPRHLLYDLVYNPAETQFLKLGAANGATTKNGYDMLVLQAEESWRIWNG